MARTPSSKASTKMRSILFFAFLIVGVAVCSTRTSLYAVAFTAPLARRRAPLPSPTSLSSSPLFSPGGDGEDSGEDFAGFNPFQPGAKIPTKGGFGVLSDEERRKPPPSAPGGQISPRQMQMKELTTDLLARLSDDEAVSELLQSNEEFLLEQLNNLDAVLEPDSVYTPEMNREERFHRYREVMDERIENARVPVAKKALGALREFVLSRE